MKKKKLLLPLLIITVLLFLIALGSYLYLTQKPNWESSYNIENAEYLIANLFQYDEDSALKGKLWINYIEADETSFVLHPQNNESIEINLNKSSMMTDSTDLSDIVKEEPYTIFLSLSFEAEDKNILEYLQCTYLKGGYCMREYTLDSWRIDSAEYPVAQLSESENKEVILENAKAGLNYNELNIINPCGNILAEYLYRRSVDKNGSYDELVARFNSEKCEDMKELVSYSLLFSTSDSIYPVLKEKVCGFLDRFLGPSDTDSFRNFFNTYELESVSNMCGIDYLRGVEYSYEFDYKSIDFNLMYLMGDHEGLEKERVEMVEFLTDKLFASRDLKYCSSEYVICSPEVVYLSRVFLMNNL